MTLVEGMAPIIALSAAISSAGFIHTKRYLMLPFTLGMLLFEVIFMALTMHEWAIRQ